MHKISTKIKLKKVLTLHALLIPLALLTITFSLSAQETQHSLVNDKTINYAQIFTYIFFTLIVLELIVIVVVSIIMLNLTKSYLAASFPKLYLNRKKEKNKTLFDKLNQSVPVTEEASIQMEHTYDNIQELDNKIPSWFSLLFLLTIVIAVLYFANYEIFHVGRSQVEEFKYNVAKAKAEYDEYIKKAGNLIDETNVQLLTDPTALSAGQDIFKANCVACHGQKGEGGIGPNLTDNYWIHGGAIEDVFKTIKYGVPDMGMLAWQSTLSALQIAQVASYIKETLHDTNPPNAKAPQGNLYTETANVVDSLKNENDNPNVSIEKVDVNRSGKEK
ncbi:MAG: cbb3-type cytochrome c oxidase N-terminal domain-containing protein [Solitalea-like symbiont of Acarus siro]